MFDMRDEVHEQVFSKRARFTFACERDSAYFVIMHSHTLLTESMIDITVMIIKASFHLTYPMGLCLLNNIP